MTDQGNGYLLESGTGRLLLESDGGQKNILIREAATSATAEEIKINNYLFVSVGNGMSTSEKIR